MKLFVQHGVRKTLMRTSFIRGGDTVLQANEIAILKGRVYIAATLCACLLVVSCMTLTQLCKEKSRMEALQDKARIEDNRDRMMDDFNYQRVKSLEREVEDLEDEVALYKGSARAWRLSYQMGGCVLPSNEKGGN